MKTDFEHNSSSGLSQGIFPLKALETETNINDMEEKEAGFSIKDLVKKENHLKDYDKPTPANISQNIEERQNDKPFSPTLQLSTKQISEFRDAFALLDQDEDGKVTGSELKNVMQSLGQNIKLNELDEILRNADDEYFSFEEFLQILQDTESMEDEQTNLRVAFRVFDRRNLGYIYGSDLRVVWSSFGVNLTENEIEEMISEVDVDKDGRINFDEFVNALKVVEERDSDENVIDIDADNQTYF